MYETLRLNSDNFKIITEINNYTLDNLIYTKIGGLNNNYKDNISGLIISSTNNYKGMVIINIGTVIEKMFVN